MLTGGTENPGGYIALFVIAAITDAGRAEQAPGRRGEFGVEDNVARMGQLGFNT